MNLSNCPRESNLRKAAVPPGLNESKETDLFEVTWTSADQHRENITELITSGKFIDGLRSRWDPEFIGLGLSRDSILTALTHKSAWNEFEEGLIGENSELHEIGKAFLELFAMITAYEVLEPNTPIGQIDLLSTIGRNYKTLLQMAEYIGISLQDMLCGKGESKSQSPRMLPEAVQSIIGAVCLDAGIEAGYKYVRPILNKVYAPLIPNLPVLHNPKVALQEILQELNKGKVRGMPPEYFEVGQTGSDHEPIFEVAVKYGTKILATGFGSSKKMAESNAAEAVLELPSLAGPKEQWIARKRSHGRKSNRGEGPWIEPSRRSGLIEFLSNIGIDSPDNNLIIEVHQSLTHRSFINESPDKNLRDYGVFSMLGSKVINSYLCMYLSQTQMLSPGDLARSVAKLITFRSSLFDSWGIEPWLLTGQGQQESNENIRADVVNALAWCLFRHGDFAAQHLIPDLLHSKIEDVLGSESLEPPTSRMQVFLQSSGITDFDYVTTNQSGPPHEPIYEVTFIVQGKSSGKGVGKNAQEARQRAAKSAWPIRDYILQRSGTRS